MSEQNEIYQAIMEKIKERDQTIKELKEKVEKLEEGKHEEEEKGKSIRGYCSKCGRTLTEEEIKEESCPDCGSRNFDTYPR